MCVCVSVRGDESVFTVKRVICTSWEAKWTGEGEGEGMGFTLKHGDLV